MSKSTKPKPLLLRLVRSTAPCTIKEDAFQAHKPEGVIDTPFQVDLRSADAKPKLTDLLTGYAVSAWTCSGTRNKANVTGYFTVIIDFDSGPGFKELQKRFAPWANVIYSTVSCTSDDPHYRVLLPLAQPLTDNSQFDSLREWLIGQFPDGDSKQFTISQMCCPCCEKYRDKASKKIVNSYAHDHFEISISIKGNFFELPLFTATKTKRPDCDWTAPPVDAAVFAKDKAALDILLRSFSPTVSRAGRVTKRSRNESAFMRAAQCRHVGMSQADCLKRLLDWNDKYVDPKFPEHGAKNGDDTSIEYIVARVYDKAYQVSPDSSEELQAARETIKDQPTSLYAPLDAWALNNQYPLAPAQCFYDDSLYYAVNYQNSMYILGQNQALLSLTEAAERGMHFRQRIPDMRFSAVDAYLGGHTVSPSEAFTRVYFYYRDYLSFLPRATLVYLSLYTIATYSFQVWQAFPYIWITAPRSSGKTEILLRMRDLCFNPSPVGTATASSLMRDINQHSCTVFYDDCEHLRHEQTGELSVIEILNLGYKADSYKSLSEKPLKGKNFESNKFSLYSPKILSSIRSIDSALQSRCHKITPPPPLLGEHSQYRPVPSVVKRQAQIRNDLYIFALEHVHQPPSIVPSADGLSNRQFEIWLPILWHSELIDSFNGNSELTDTMLTLANQSQQEMLSDTRTPDAALPLLVALKSLFDTVTSEIVESNHFYAVSTVYDFLKAHSEFATLKDADKHKWLTTILTETLGIAKSQKYKHVRGYLFNMEHFHNVYSEHTTVAKGVIENA